MAPKAGQACAVATARPSSVEFIKRVVGLPGDRLALVHGHVIRNGRRARRLHQAVRRASVGACDFPTTLTVPSGAYYVLGDNRGASDDSRFWGAVPVRWILGRVVRVAIS